MEFRVPDACYYPSGQPHDLMMFVSLLFQEKQTKTYQQNSSGNNQVMHAQFFTVQPHLE